MRGLRTSLVGRTITSAEVRWARAVDRPSVQGLVDGVTGGTVTGVSRRAKFIVIALGDAHLLVHLRMAGRLLLCRSAAIELVQDPYVRAAFHLDDGSVLLFRDVRKFGRLYLVQDPSEVVGALGPEPLADGFTPAVLRNCMTRRRQIKPLLLDQHVVAGLGNIYVDEALWKARLHPLRRADTLNDDDIRRLHAAVRSVLTRAINDGGTTLRDYRDCEGEVGQHQYALAVYGRAGEACPRCGGAIERIVVGQRGTHICARCQH